MENLIIIGIGANSRLAYSFVKSHNLYNIIGFAVNEEYKTTDKFEGLPVYSLEKIREEIGHSNFVCFISLLWNHLNRDRRKIYQFCKEHDIPLTNLISPLAIVRSKISGDNIWIHDYVVIQNDTILGSNIAIMQGSLIGADCKIASHCFFGAHSVFGGGSIIGEQSFVGLHATVFDDTSIGKKCIVGACTAVKRNMPDFSKYITPSDNIIVKQYTENEIENKLVFFNNKR